MIVSDEYKKAKTMREFQALATPLMEFLNREDIFHPLVIIITTTSAEMVKGDLNTIKEGYYAESNRPLHPAKG